MVATLRAGLAHQRLARLTPSDGMELDVSALPRLPSGRIERDAADALFETVRERTRRRPRQLAALVSAGPRLRLRGRPQPGPGGHAEGRRAAGTPMSKTLLIVHHTPSPHCQEMFEAVLAGATDPEIEGVEVVRRPALTVRRRHAGGRRLSAGHPGQPRLHQRRAQALLVRYRSITGMRRHHLRGPDHTPCTAAASSPAYLFVGAEF